MYVAIVAYTTQGTFVVIMPQVVVVASEALQCSVTMDTAGEIRVVELGGVGGVPN